MKKIDSQLLKAFEFMILGKIVRITKKLREENKEFLEGCGNGFVITNIDYDGKLEIQSFYNHTAMGGIEISDIIF